MSKLSSVQFNKFYGPGSAQVITFDNKHYLRMKKIVGIPMGSTDKPLPSLVLAAYNNAIDKMQARGVINNDCSLGDFIFKQRTMEAHPKDMGQCANSSDLARTAHVINSVNEVNTPPGSRARKVAFVPDPTCEAGAFVVWSE